MQKLTLIMDLNHYKRVWRVRDSNPRDACDAYTQACSFGQLGQLSTIEFYLRYKKQKRYFTSVCMTPTDSNPCYRRERAVSYLDQGAMAPQVGFEPTTDRLTADSSTTELLWINKMERVMGIEPTTSAWKAEVLPLNYTRVV